MSVSSQQQNSSNDHSGFEHVSVLLQHLRLKWLLQHFPARFVWAAYVGVNGFVTIAMLSLLALFTGSPFVFPSLGPTAFLFFFSPTAAASSPRNTIFGHAIGLACGYAAFMLTVWSGQPASVHGGIHGPTVLAAALSLSLTGALLVLFKVSHPPAGATTLIVSLGIIAQPKDLLVIEAAVILLTAQAFVLNRLAGIPYPFWHKGLSVRPEGHPWKDTTSTEVRNFDIKSPPEVDLRAPPQG